MTAISDHYEMDTFDSQSGEPVLVSNEAFYIPRSRFLSLLFLPSTLLCGVSWLVGGSSMLTDFGFLLLTLICTILLVVELVRFPRRFGIGGLILFGGVLVWMCQDYMSHWLFKRDVVAGVDISREVIAKAAFFTCLMVMCMTIGLCNIGGRWAEKLFMALPDVKDSSLCFWIMLAAFIFGISPYFLFTSEPGYLAIYHQIIGGRAEGAAWTVGRSGNLNYNWGAYVAQILQVGQIGAIYALFYSILIARNVLAKATGWAIWGLWLLIGLGSGTRGETVAMLLPAVLLLFVKDQLNAAIARKAFSIRAYLVALIVFVFTLVAVQFQITFRETGYRNASLDQVDVLNIRGNTMFSEGLAAYAAVPDRRGFFYDRYGLDGILRPIPDTLFWFLVGPMPRALWNDKPVDPVWEWYNQLVTGNANGREGTTVSTGLSAHWYIRYGIWGVIEGGMLFGWLIAIGERVFRQANGRMNLLLLTLGWETWLFRSFRAFLFVELYALLIGITFLAVLTMIWNSLTTGPEATAEIQS